jgi:predicted secreted protein
MTATVIGGFGLIVQIKISSTLTAIAQLLDGEIPEFEKFIAEMTPHNASGGYAVQVATGKRKMNEFKVTLGWDSDDSTHAAILTAFASNDPVDMAVITPGTDESIAFSAHITKVGRVSPQEDGMKCDVSIQPTGAPTIT